MAKTVIVEKILQQPVFNLISAKPEFISGALSWRSGANRESWVCLTGLVTLQSLLIHWHMHQPPPPSLFIYLSLTFSLVQKRISGSLELPGLEGEQVEL